MILLRVEEREYALPLGCVVEVVRMAALTPAPGAPGHVLGLLDLRGRVVLIEFWTFGCYNCRNTLPFVKGWDARYRAKGLTVIMNRCPKIEYGRLSGEIGWQGVNSRILSAKKPMTLAGAPQGFIPWLAADLARAAKGRAVTVIRRSPALWGGAPYHSARAQGISRKPAFSRI